MSLIITWLENNKYIKKYAIPNALLYFGKGISIFFDIHLVNSANTCTHTQPKMMMVNIRNKNGSFGTFQEIHIKYGEIIRYVIIITIFPVNSFCFRKLVINHTIIRNCANIGRIRFIFLRYPYTMCWDISEKNVNEGSNLLVNKGIYW